LVSQAFPEKMELGDNQVNVVLPGKVDHLEPRGNLE